MEGVGFVRQIACQAIKSAGGDQPKTGFFPVGFESIFRIAP
jgi:hypothetical protein